MTPTIRQVDDAPEQRSATPSFRLRVLVAEDNSVNQKLATALLEREGHGVTLAVNGQEAVELATQADFDLILMDIQMPVLDGLDATRQIRDWERRVGGHVPIIALTARAMVGDRETCLAAGMDSYLSKPVRADRLFEEIGKLVPAAARVHDASITVHAADDVFDGPALLEIAQGDRALARQLAHLFLDDAPAQLAAMRSAMAAQDARGVREAAHAMRGAAGTITAARVAADARALESAAASGDLQDASRILEALDARLAELRERLVPWCVEAKER